MQLAQLLKGITMLETSAEMTLEIKGISYDSRTTAPGDLFVAVKGFETDGHQYVDAAVAKGAVCVLCMEKPETDIPYVVTGDTRRALAVVSATWFNTPASKLKIIGVTGTNGKTTTTTLIKTVIEKCTGEKVGLIGTNTIEYGDHVVEASRTTPESYEVQKYLREMADNGCSYVVMEVSSHALLLERVHGLRFVAGVFTNLTHEHLDFHKTMDEYAEAKARIFKQSDHGVVNLDDTYADVMIKSADCPVMTFSAEKDEADLVAKQIRVFSDRVEFCALMMEKLQRIELNIPAMFTVYNALATIAVGTVLGFETEAIAQALKTCSGIKGRIEVVPTDRDFTVIIDYAHKPYALENIIRTFKALETGRVVTLFGCGGDRDKAKRPLMGAIAAELSDFVIVTSDNPRTEEPGEIIKDILAGMQETKTPYSVIENRKEAIRWALENAHADDIIILAGKGHETYQIIGKEKFHFDEREIVADVLSAK